MTDMLSLYRALVARGTQPALTWYGAQGRMELSGKVSANHLAKIAGYLSDELWLEPGAQLELDLPAHWKQVLWGLGAMLAGLRPVVIGADSAAPQPLSPRYEALITNRPEAYDPAETQAEAIAALDLGPLALRWSGPPLASGFYDASAEVLGSPDQLMDESRHGEANFEQWRGYGTLTRPGERLLVGGEGRILDPAVVLASATLQLGGGSLVVVETGDVDEIAQVEGAKITQFIRK
ncbi:TIGR03089 family protein [Actinomycetaceae bacterium L2_0104]